MLAAWYIGSVILGASFGFIVATLFRRVAPGGSTKRYWAAAADAIRGLLYSDSDEFWHHYGALIGSSLAYIARQLLAVLVAFLPMVIVVFLVAPLLWAQWDEGAGLMVSPPESARLISPGAASSAAVNAGRALQLADGTLVELPEKPGAIAVCTTGELSCYALISIGFTVVDHDGAAQAHAGPIIVRSWHDDWNPFWPYLNDPEFLFLTSLVVFSLALMFRPAAGTGYEKSRFGIGGTDYLLSQLATSNAGLLKKFGDFETRRYSSELMALSLDRPVFISGLARSGTTILLEKLSTLAGFATHRYRDFPFVMVPLYWNKFITLFGRERDAVERPHQDSIKITRDSPDAFEEPIWQHFFPAVHNPEKLHTLSAADRLGTFDEFYQSHLRKILLLRNGNRYLSKGNYNLPRIEYIADLFPNALFLVMIRHPYSHVESLVRQHQLFNQYAVTDPNIGKYLQSAGHFEFGPQRQPINVCPKGTEFTLDSWSRGDEFAGYAQQWADVYDYVERLRAARPEFSNRIKVIRFEDMRARPLEEFERILAILGHTLESSAENLAADIRPPAEFISLPSDVTDKIWSLTGATAEKYGYIRETLIPQWPAGPKRVPKAL